MVKKINQTFISGDTHGNIDRLKLRFLRKSKTLGINDVIIIAGDWGVLWGPGYEDEEKRLLEWYGRFPCTVLIVDGNHDNHDKFDVLPTVFMFGNEVGKISDNIFHLRRGHVYDINDNKYFIFGGALSTDQDFRTIGVDWWPGELPTRKQMDKAYEELDACNWSVDYVVTHTGPRSVLDELGFGVTSARFNDPTAAFLESIKNQLKFDQWFFGHMHVDEMTPSSDGTNVAEFVVLYKSVVQVWGDKEETMVES